MKIKKLCKLSKKDVAKHILEIAEIVKKPKFVCTECCRAANDKSHLCKPTKLRDEAPKAS